ncbi:MAG: hypothetical protein H9W82_12135 [Lactobacillus sp.]|nr:hypothetical protein [Lactobacillus sp.]
MDLKFNKFGKVKMDQIRELDLVYVDETEKEGFVTYSELKNELYQKYGLRIHWNYDERVKYCDVWYCSKLNRGCSPLYITDAVYVALRTAERNLPLLR